MTVLLAPESAFSDYGSWKKRAKGQTEGGIRPTELLGEVERGRIRQASN